VRELYYDLFLAYTNIDLLTDLATLFSRVEDAAVAATPREWPAAGSIDGADGEIHASRAEEMERQKIRSLEAMLNAAVGRDRAAPLGRPEHPGRPYGHGLDELITAAMKDTR